MYFRTWGPPSILFNVKYANEDNCGVSCQNTTQKQSNNESDKDDEYLYMMGYESVH